MRYKDKTTRYFALRAFAVIGPVVFLVLACPSLASAAQQSHSHWTHAATGDDCAILSEVVNHGDFGAIEPSPDRPLVSNAPSAMGVQNNPYATPPARPYPWPKGWVRLSSCPGLIESVHRRGWPVLPASPRLAAKKCKRGETACFFRPRILPGGQAARVMYGSNNGYVFHLAKTPAGWKVLDRPIEYWSNLIDVLH